MSVEATFQPNDPTCTREELRECVDAKVGGFENLGPGPKRRASYGYYLPAEVYECLVQKMVTPETTWLDVGGGKTVFPQNPALAQTLADRCQHLAAVDPSDNINTNPYAHETQQALLEDYETDRKFDLITMRMVIEHVANPTSFMAKLHDLLKPGGTCVALTVWKYSPVSLAAAVVPFRLHHAIKKLVWRDSKEEDTFPTTYLLNTRAAQRRYCEEAGLKLESYQRLNDCSVTCALGRLGHLELVAERTLRSVGIVYPEHCILSCFRRDS
ncbi:MAG: methyltransferase domain-containing protein [Planctomycetota bacterium]